MLCGRAVGEVHGRRLPLRPLVAVAGNTGGVERREPRVKACGGTDGEGQVAAEPSPALRMELLERTTELKPLAPLGLESRAQEEGERCIGTTWRREGHGCMGQAQASEEHPSDGFTRCEGVWRIGRQAGIEHVEEASVFQR